jgi:RNA polymerase sigma factor (sigma-70 family)
MIYNALYTTLGSELRGWLVNRLKGGTGRIDFEDLMQATWLNVWRGLDTFASLSEGRGTAVGRLKTWVFTVARNLHVDAERHEATIRMQSLEALTRIRAMTGEEHIEHYEKEWEPDFADAFDDREEAAWVAERVKRELTPGYVLLLQLVGSGMSHDEIGVVLNVSRQAVKARVARARQNALQALQVDNRRVASVEFKRRYTRRNAAIAHISNVTVST